MFSHWPQIIIPAYLVLVALGAPVLRTVLIRRGNKGFTPWPDFWAKWGFDLFNKTVLVCVLYIGGFWN